jgi:sRNA-binding protein
LPAARAIDGNLHGQVTAREIAAAKAMLANIETAQEKEKAERIEDQRTDAKASRMARIERAQKAASRLSLAPPPA